MLHADILGERARLSPDRTALVCVHSGLRFTYAELDARACRLAATWLGRCGFVPGDRVALLAHNGVEYVDALFAAAKSGLVLVPLSTRATPHELEGILRDCAPRALVYGPGFADTLTTLAGRVTIAAWIALDAAARRDPHDAVIAELCAGASQAPIEPTSDPEAPLCLLYTSGTTGAPKGVIVPHRMVSWNAYNTAVCWQLREEDVSPVFTPLYHAGGLGAFLLPILAAGGTIVLHRGFDTAEIWDVIARERCTVVLGVPTIWKLLADSPSFSAADLSSVRWFISGGAPLPQVIIDTYQARGVTFKQGYGLTEVGVNCFAMSVDDSVRKAGSIGRPLMFTRAKLIAEDGTEVRVGDIGELCLKGPHVCLGYWQNPEATAAALDADGWFHTGDLARADEDHFFYIAGRKKDMIISGGVNVYPAEVEAALLSHPGVADAAVIGVPDDTWGEVGVAFVVRAAGSAVERDVLAAHLAGLVARYKVPRDFVLVDALPRTPYGKVVKADLRSRYAAQPAREPREEAGSDGRPRRR